MSDAPLVLKFGGSSVKDADAMLRVVDIAVDRKASIVVVSATQGTTDLLESLSQSTDDWTRSGELIEAIRQRHLQIAKELEAPKGVVERLQFYLENLGSLSRGVFLLKECSPKFRDRMLCVGEMLSSTLMEQAFRLKGKEITFVDMRDVLKTDYRYGRALPLLEETRVQAEKFFDFKKGSRYITQGFIASAPDGTSTTLGRGGSDYSAALIAEALRARHLEIWTDVTGVATTDPRICPEARRLKELGFEEASELATYGAKVLHPTTILPSIRQGFPIYVGNSQKPEAEGTWIVPNPEERPLIRAVSIKNDQSFLRIQNPEMSRSWGFLSKIFAVFDRFELSVDMVTTSEISVGLTVDDATLLNKEFIAELRQLGKVEIDENLALISIVGNDVHKHSGLLHEVLGEIRKINTRAISGGASSHHFCFLVDEVLSRECVQLINRRFLEQ